MTRTDQLATDTAMGAVTLRVADLDAMTAYYRDAVRLTVRSEGSGRVELGRPGRTLLVLEHTPSLRHAGPREAGLYHTALLFETPADLAAAIWSVAEHRPGSFTGSSDHTVSRAFYFDDPEGNGVELYTDRDRADWPWQQGRIAMTGLPLDPRQFLTEHLDEQSVQQAEDRPAVVGHVHLSVGDVASAREFYVDRLGFDETASYGGRALFVSAGGYHHHMAMNTWQSAGAGRRRDTLGLGLVRIDVPGREDLDALAERLRRHGVATGDDGRTLGFEDPWANRVEVRVAA